MGISLAVETVTYVTEAADPSDSWSRDSTGGYVSDVTAHVDNTPNADSTLDVPIGTLVFGVVASYEGGDTFGRSGGYFQTLGVFATREEAQRLADVARAQPSGSFLFTHENVQYHPNWTGYFDELQDIRIWDVQVEGPR